MLHRILAEALSVAMSYYSVVIVSNDDVIIYSFRNTFLFL